jgi:hypothetical protein
MADFEQFVLERVIEVDLDFGDQVFPVRLEFFASATRSGRFRCRMWRSETYAVAPRRGAPSADEELLVNWEPLLSRDFRSYDAPDLGAAMSMVLDDLRERVASAAETADGSPPR